MKRMLMLGLLLMALGLPAAAQEAAVSPVITADNVRNLQSAMQINFADYAEDAGEFATGAFALARNAHYSAAFSETGMVLIWEMSSGSLIDQYVVKGQDGLPARIVDAAFSPDGALLASLHSDGDDFRLILRNIGQRTTVQIIFLGENLENDRDAPIRVWFDAVEPYVWLEVIPFDVNFDEYLLAIPFAEDADLETFIVPSALAQSSIAYARIGRIAPPFGVTSSETGLVQVWNLQTGSVIHEAEAGGLAVFGQINNTATRLAWRDPQSVDLNLLDFRTGENRVIAPLNGEYVQWFFVSDAADVVLGVHVGDDPTVVAWDVATGERITLGQYRECGRVPDMVRLSRDGTTLAIGCDMGLEVWRIEE